MRASSLPVTCSPVSVTSTTVESSTTDATEQGSGVRVAIMDVTDQAGRCALDTTPQDSVTNDAIPDRSEGGENPSDAEEAKREIDDPLNQLECVVDLDVFDSDNFMAGLRKERLFVPTPEDDVNMVATADLSGSESDADDEDVTADNW
ncbi:unnamed protein product [Phytophthora fragariaefolia]|uniref:Unnamed protein product n=1 Tax=Phytophthora fragariaefolia TaxID=1490495 RepID=A0A9W6XD16_9STRA|nr:unnamed protein product [Phytophthora fragariaefolia]